MIAKLSRRPGLTTGAVRLAGATLPLTIQRAGLRYQPSNRRAV